MPLLGIPADEEIAPAVRQGLETYRRIFGYDKVPDTARLYATSRAIVEARVAAAERLHAASSFPLTTRFVAIMLIAHARRCRTCFRISRATLEGLGFDEDALDGMCRDPEGLPLDQRDRDFVAFAIKVATASADLKPRDLQEMVDRGFSREEVQEIVAFAAYWAMTMVFSQSALAALAEE